MLVACKNENVEEMSVVRRPVFVEYPPYEMLSYFEGRSRELKVIDGVPDADEYGQKTPYRLFASYL